MYKEKFGEPAVRYKYSEDRLLKEIHQYVDNTYGEHYKTDEMECNDVWIALGDVLPTYRNTAIKYLWRVGKKGDKTASRKDILKAIHYCLFMLHVMDKENDG